MCIAETQFSEPRFSEILDLMNKLQLPFSYFTLYPELVNKRGLTAMFTKSSLGCTLYNMAPSLWISKVTFQLCTIK